MRLLVAKIEEKNLKNLLWLDELCNGLLSQARFQSFFDKENEETKLVLRPVFAPIQGAYILTKDSEKISFKDLTVLFPDCREVVLGEGMKPKESEEAAKAFAQVTTLADFLRSQGMTVA